MIALPPGGAGAPIDRAAIAFPGCGSSSAGSSRCPHQRPGGEHETAALEGILPARDLVHLVDVRPERDVNVLAGLVECLSGERHPVLPADERSDPHARLTIRHRRPSGGLGVSRAPHHSLGVRRHQLAVVVEQRAAGAEGENGVVERAATRPLL